jgi:transposase InsO family protein
VSAFIDANRERLGVEPICRELEVSASAYRARRSRPPSARSLRDLWLLAQIRRVHADSSGIYGQFKVWDELNESGVRVARCTVERLMRAHGIAGVGPAKTKKTTLPGARPVAAPDLVRRNFTASRPDELWLADFTYVRTWEGWAYLAVILDVYTRRIVGWQLAPHMRQSLVSDAFEMALHARQEHEDGLIAHSDNGSQYTSYEYTERLKRAGIAPSRGRTGTALDNAMAESVISTIKRELIKRYSWPTRLDLELALVTYIGWYNSRRRHRSLRHQGKGRIRRVAPAQMLDLYNQQRSADSMLPRN